MSRVRRQCVTCNQRYLVYKGGKNDVQFFICSFCKGDLESLRKHKHIETVRLKGEAL